MPHFPGSSAGRKSACNAGDPSSISGSGRSPGEGIGYPLQYSWVPLVAQLVKNPPALWETWVRSLHWEDSLEKGTATYTSILAWRISWTVQFRGCKESDMTERLSLEQTLLLIQYLNSVATHFFPGILLDSIFSLKKIFFLKYAF